MTLARRMDNLIKVARENVRTQAYVLLTLMQGLLKTKFLSFKSTLQMQT